MLRIRIAVSGAARRMWRAATAPFMLGMREIHHHHLRAEFGGQFHGLDVRRSASPTTRIAGSSSSMRRKPRRTRL